MNSKKEVSGWGRTKGDQVLTFGRCGEPHLSVLEDLVQFRAGVLIGAGTAICVVTVAAFHAEPEGDTLLGGLGAFAMHASVRA